MLMKPAFKDYIWGGTRLRDDFHKDCDYARIAESWELSCHPDGLSVIGNGIYAGQTLSDLIKTEDILGRNAAHISDSGDCPVLIKLIDAKENLSVQVHPNDAYMKSHGGGFGKTEMWYVMDANPGAELIFGFKQAITKDEFRARIADNTLLEAVNRVKVKKGDVFFIKAGTLHAIGAGLLIAEIQQNSNTTYRVYDYNRKDKDGNSRELHIDNAVEVTNLTPADYNKAPVDSELPANEKFLAKCAYFTVFRLDITDKTELDVTDDSFCSLLVTDGCGTLRFGDTDYKLCAGDCYLLPSGMGKCTVSGHCTVLKTII
jgi:mannose-6-phosphate isomerase